MSGAGGYYKYHCKYWLTYNCPNWADDRDDEFPPKEDVRSTESSVRVSGRASRLTEGASSQGGLRAEDFARYCIEQVSLLNFNDNSSIGQSPLPCNDCSIRAGTNLGEVVTPKETAKILGVIMDSKLRYKQQIASAATKGLLAAMALKSRRRGRDRSMDTNGTRAARRSSYQAMGRSSYAAQVPSQLLALPPRICQPPQPSPCHQFYISTWVQFHPLKPSLYAVPTPQQHSCGQDRADFIKCSFECDSRAELE
ncbi:RNA-directed DNA polymerase/Ribonuclease H [Chlorociboria aeruginascens]|nr:RNA-directed DNA polymerase/Ribonuclease H [Chlorociboria aeruginascens]